jgi:hypothetical protein
VELPKNNNETVTIKPAKIIKITMEKVAARKI